MKERFRDILLKSSSSLPITLIQSIGYTQAMFILLFSGWFGSVLPINVPLKPFSSPRLYSPCLHFLSLFLPLLPCGLHLSDCLLMLPLGFLNVWLIQRSLLFPIFSIIGTWPAISQRSSFQTLLSHLIRRMVLGHILTKVRTFLDVSALVFHVSHPHSRSDFTFELKSLNFVYFEILVALSQVG